MIKVYSHKSSQTIHRAFSWILTNYRIKRLFLKDKGTGSPEDALKKPLVWKQFDVWCWAPWGWTVLRCWGNSPACCHETLNVFVCMSTIRKLMICLNYWHTDWLQMRLCVQAEEDLGRAQKIFEELNVELQDELPTLWEKCGAVFPPWKSVICPQSVCKRVSVCVCAVVLASMSPHSRLWQVIRTSSTRRWARSVPVHQSSSSVDVWTHSW